MARTSRQALFSVERYIATVETSKHRFFQFLDASVRPDNKLMNIGLESPSILSVLSSRPHVHWAVSKGGWLGVGNDPVYAKTDTLDPFPFPACVTDDSDPELNARLAELGERLDAFRKERLAEHEFLTMTGMYNVLERMRELENTCNVEPLSDRERDIHEAGLISVLKEIHDDIDRAALEAYDFADLVDTLVGKPGGTIPSAHKSDAQEAAEEELLTRLVALNQERAAEEKRGQVRWLRPDFQVPKLGHRVAVPTEEQISAEMDVIEIAEKPKWPGDGLDQIRLVREVLGRAEAPAPAEAIARAFDGRLTDKRRGRIEQVLTTLLESGVIRSGELDGERRYFLPR